MIITKPTFKVCTWYVHSDRREWWFPETFDEAMEIALENYPALIMLNDPSGTFVGTIEVGEKQHKEWVKTL